MTTCAAPTRGSTYSYGPAARSAPAKPSAAREPEIARRCAAQKCESKGERNLPPFTHAVTVHTNVLQYEYVYMLRMYH